VPRSSKYTEFSGKSLNAVYPLVLHWSGFDRVVNLVVATRANLKDAHEK